jgi:hypothetical protein
VEERPGAGRPQTSTTVPNISPSPEMCGGGGTLSFRPSGCSTPLTAPATPSVILLHVLDLVRGQQQFSRGPVSASGSVRQGRSCSQHRCLPLAIKKRGLVLFTGKCINHGRSMHDHPTMPIYRRSRLNKHQITVGGGAHGGGKCGCGGCRRLRRPRRLRRLLVLALACRATLA